jgi:hypothetical protein
LAADVLAFTCLQAAHAARERSQAAAAVIGGVHDESGSDFSLEGAADSDDDAGQDMEQGEDDESQEEEKDAWWVAHCPALVPEGVSRCCGVMTKAMQKLDNVLAWLTRNHNEAGIGLDSKKHEEEDVHGLGGAMW